jgi:UDP-N-acetylmuramoylalanine--D-glutamate ligase
MSLPITWNLDQFDGKDVVFVGIGRGRSAHGTQHFLETYGNIKSFTGINKTPDISFADQLSGFDPATTVFIKNEGIPGAEVPVPYVSPLQIFFDNVGLTGATTVGVTGTKGKSTTTSLTVHILKSAGKNAVLAGNIGISPLLMLGKADASTIFVLEMSSYQLVDVHASPHISACINLFNDHVDVHGTLENYWEAKRNIMRYAGPDDVFVYNPDFPAMRKWAEEAHCKTIAIDPSEQLDLSSAHLYGDHNRLNALVAREIARQFGVSDETSLAAINSFEPLKHRMQTVAVKNDTTYIDDAIGMTPESTLASLQAVTQKIGPVSCLLLGGQDRGYDFTSLMQTIADQHIPSLVLFPDTTEKMKAAIPEGYNPEIFETTSMGEAVGFARQHATPGSVVLLSTAAPSYSLWRDFEEKGDQFVTAVEAI